VQVQQVSPPQTPAKPNLVEPEFIVVDVGNDRRGYGGKMIFPYSENPITALEELKKNNFAKVKDVKLYNNIPEWEKRGFIFDPQINITQLPIGFGLTFEKFKETPKETDDVLNKMQYIYGKNHDKLREAKRTWFQISFPESQKQHKTTQKLPRGGKYTLKRPRK
jgi:hypothetical protein